MIEIGFRVARGPDWKWHHQDNGEGHVGTVVEIGRPNSASSPDKTVVVQWDMGARTNYRVGYQDAYDLRLFDNAPAGVRHPNVICDGCKDHGISGILWKCSRCSDFDLCTTCYMNDTHDLSHPFKRFETPGSVGVQVDPRQNSSRVVSRGIFAGARVVRGPDWDWGNQDGGDGKVGRVVDIRGWDNESGRSVANVVWSSGSTNVYRLGHKGKVDLKCIQASSAGSYYSHHLPVLGLPHAVSLIASTSSSDPPVASSAKNISSVCNFFVGDKVQACADVTKLKELQEGHGGWNPKMVEYIPKIGTVHRVTEKGDIRVQYDTGIRWTYNPAAVTKITSFSVGDVVKVIEDAAKVKDLQFGHGEWVDAMKDILGKTGTISKVYPDSDLRIKIGEKLWTMNPKTVKPLPSDRFESNNSMYANANRREDNSSQDPMISMLPHFLDSVSLDGASSVERLVREAAQGHVEAVKAMLPKLKDRLNHKSSGKTALQVASHQGHVGIVAMLVANKVNLEVVDDDGDTALHYSAFGNKYLVMDILLKAGASVDAVNKNQCTPLHIAVNKKYIDCVTCLLKFKCKVNIQDSYGDTALHDAISKNQHDVINLLVNTPGIDFTLKNRRGFNVLHHASLKGNDYAIENIILKARQLVDVKKDDGFSALHLSCLNGHYNVSKYLIEQGGADVNIRNNRKQTPLLLAVSQGYCAIIELLISRNADVSLEEEDGDTPLHIIFTRHFANSQLINNQIHNINPAVMSELKNIEGAPLIGRVHLKLLALGWDPLIPIFDALALACYIAQCGGDLNKKNRKRLTPLDLAPTDKLRSVIKSFSPQYGANGDGNGPDPRVPSGDTSSTQRSSTNDSQTECELCSEISELIIFEPCGHQVVCEECCVRMKKCVTCHVVIVKKLKRQGHAIKPIDSTHNNTERLRYLENKYAEMEETFCCPICLERRRNVAFLCGHGACEKCAVALNTCHMCRLPIRQKINLY